MYHVSQQYVKTLREYSFLHILRDTKQLVNQLFVYTTSSGSVCWVYYTITYHIQTIGQWSLNATALHKYAWNKVPHSQCQANPEEKETSDCEICRPAKTLKDIHSLISHKYRVLHNVHGELSKFRFAQLLGWLSHCCHMLQAKTVQNAQKICNNGRF